MRSYASLLGTEGVLDHLKKFKEGSDKDAAARIRDYFVNEYDATKQNHFGELNILQACLTKLRSESSTADDVAGSVAILDSMFVRVPAVLQQYAAGFDLELLGKWFNTFPNEDTIQETQVQLIITQLIENFYKAGAFDAQTAARIMVRDRLKKYGVIFYPHFYFNTLLLWGEASLLSDALQKSKTSLSIKLIKVQGRELVAKDMVTGLSDPFFEAGVVNGRAQFKSSVKKKTLSPDWDMSAEKNNIIKVRGHEEVVLTMYDKDLILHDFMGTFKFFPAHMYALQEKALDNPLGQVTVIVKPGNYGHRKMGKDKHDDRVSGYLAITMHISKEK